MDLGLDGAAAVVVGGSRGIGLATARALADDGARVALVARSRYALDAAVEDLGRRRSRDTVGLVADTRDRAQVEAVFEQVGKRWDGELNILINAVGTPVVGSVDNLTDEQWHVAVDDIALGMVRSVRAALPLLRRAGWARVVNFAAQSTQRQNAMMPAYTAAKAMVVSISKNLSLMLAADRILVNVVSPGTIATDGLVGWAESIGIEPTDLGGMMDAVAETVGHAANLRRAGDPVEVGVVAAFLASQRNSYMTGANVNVDGGSHFV